MNVSYYTSEFASQVSQVSPWSIPGTLWAYYLEYLWFYETDSWVARIAYAARILAILVSLPLLILGLLDIASYGVARTLGVIDDVKASTSDKSTVHNTSKSEAQPVIYVQSVTSPSSDSMFSDSDRESFTDHSTHDVLSPLSASLYTGESQPPIFYASAGEEHNLKLSGVDVFSPAASQPPSPTLTRQQLPYEGTLSGKEKLRHRTHQVGKNAN